MKGVFQTKLSPAYDDVPEQRYHFPKTYLNQAQRTVGDWIIYYEPRRSTADDLSRGGRQAYFAIAQVSGIRPDAEKPDHFYADVKGFLPFDNSVPFRHGDFYYEKALRGADGRTNAGSAQRAIRNMSDAEFDLIVRAGFAAQLGSSGPLAIDSQEGFSEPPPILERPLIETTVLRPFRDRVFVRQVQAAYEQRCAMTGIKIVNGGGRSEAQAAHIRPVEKDGPDSVRNGISLSSTFHWMFDRGLLSVDDDFRILRAKGRIPPELERLLKPSGFLSIPDDVRLQPHRTFLKFHRETIFKG